uniref:Uncharacterized protein n=1 Tax=Haptolina brevifila TaxID=156173 RepID=A0A7S2NNH8_9EUKA
MWRGSWRASCCSCLCRCCHVARRAASTKVKLGALVARGRITGRARERRDMETKTEESGEEKEMNEARTTAIVRVSGVEVTDACLRLRLLADACAGPWRGRERQPGQGRGRG